MLHIFYLELKKNPHLKILCLSIILIEVKIKLIMESYHFKAVKQYSDEDYNNGNLGYFNAFGII